jgi:hypothetical protein
LISVFLSSGKLADDLLKNPFFNLYDSHFTIKIKDEIKIFQLDEISNVRFSKKRNFTINISLLFITLLIYSFVSDYLDKNLLYDIVLFVVSLILSIISLSIKDHTYVLFINMSHFGFREFKLSKKESPYAEYFVSIFKTKFMEIKNQNVLDFVNFKHSS